MGQILDKISWLILFVALVTLTTGCSTADQYLGSTEASYDAPGVKGYYKSNKNQQGFKASMVLGEDGKMRTLNVETTATTPEAAIAAAAMTNLEIIKQYNATMQMLMPLITKGLAGGGVSVPSVPPVK